MKLNMGNEEEKANVFNETTTKKSRITVTGIIRFFLLLHVNEWIAAFGSHD